MLRIGLVMLQGARHAHIASIEAASSNSQIPVEVHEIRKLSDLQSSDPHAIILPGGESTTMRLTGLDKASNLLPSLFQWIRDNPDRPVLGTCAGAILLSEPQDGGLPLVDACIDRNAYGRQSDSFQDTIYSPLLERDFPGVFIRAPRFTSNDAEISAMHGEEVVGVRSGNVIALTFHPELSGDPGFHDWLLGSAKESME
ncbi:MAG: pyridoxal 5'-phosphate synthase glutaminase subunit PdxT [Euryarchaeota archaeon]|nr:pyridoxal 5'-phosphate synthase glutaminase subunit PdxT [Euryarchaeota archaeon]